MPKKKITLDDLATIMQSEFHRINDTIVGVKQEISDLRNELSAEMNTGFDRLHQEIFSAKDQSLRRDDHLVDRVVEQDKRIVVIEDHLGIKRPQTRSV